MGCMHDAALIERNVLLRHSLPTDGLQLARSVPRPTFNNLPVCRRLDRPPRVPEASTMQAHLIPVSAAAFLEIAGANIYGKSNLALQAVTAMELQRDEV